MSILLTRAEIENLTDAKTATAQCRWFDVRNWIYRLDQLLRDTGRTFKTEEEALAALRPYQGGDHEN